VSGKFRIEEIVGSGSMGVVYRAQQVALSKDVAIKILRRRLVGDPLVARRFKQEARAASRLNHPNSIQILDFGELDDGLLYMAMEYVEGTDLASIIQNEGPLPPERITHLMTQACSALYEAHINGVVHRDLKPANILVSDLRSHEDFVKVLDFGIAKILDPDPGHSIPMTREGFVCGTPAYMSPEQVQGFKLDHRTDIFSVGIILYQAMTGKLPFSAPTPLDMATKIVMEPVPRPSEQFPDVPIHPGLEEICMRCLEKKVGDRYQTAMEIMGALEAADEVVPDTILAESGEQAVATPLDGRFDSPAARAGESKRVEAEEAGASDQAPSGQPTVLQRRKHTPPTKEPTPALTPADRPNRAHLDLPRALSRDSESGRGATSDPLSETAESLPQLDVARPRRRMIVLALVAAVIGFLAVTALLETLSGEAVEAPPPPEAQDSAQPAPVPPAADGPPADEPPEAAEAPAKQDEKPAAARPKRRKKRRRSGDRVRRTRKTTAPAAETQPGRREAPAAAPSRSARARALMKEADALRRGGHSDKALAKLKAALGLNPRLATAHRDLGRVYMRKGDKKKAQRHFEKYLSLAPNARDARVFRQIIAGWQ